MREVERSIIQELTESIRVKEKAKSDLIPDIAEAAKLIIKSLKNGSKVLLFGNGGSAADAQHLACELVSRLKMKRGVLPAIALTTNTSILTAIGNDYDFATIFSRQVEALIQKDDVAIGISTSGNSPNVLNALKAARKGGAVTIGLTGQKGQKMCKLVDLCLKVPSTNTPRIQEAHITIGHIICSLVEKEIFGEKTK